MVTQSQGEIGKMGGVTLRRPVSPSSVSPRFSFRRRLFGAYLLGLGAVSSAAAQDTVLFGLKLPPGYFNRFDRIEVLASNTGGTGIRFLPVPISTDLRLTLVKTPTALEYGIGIQLGNLGVQVGVFNGVPRAEMNQWLASGFQWNGLVQGRGHCHGLPWATPTVRTRGVSGCSTRWGWRSRPGSAPPTATARSAGWPPAALAG